MAFISSSSGFTCARSSRYRAMSARRFARVIRSAGVGLLLGLLDTGPLLIDDGHHGQLVRGKALGGNPLGDVRQQAQLPAAAHLLAESGEDAARRLDLGTRVGRGVLEVVGPTVGPHRP